MFSVFATVQISGRLQFATCTSKVFRSCKATIDIEHSNGALLMDLSSAFDTLDHELLLDD